MKALFGIGINWPEKAIAAAIIAGAVAIGCAATPQAGSFGLDAPHADLVRQTCTDVMGLERGTARFDACGHALAQSLHDRSDASRLATAHESCEREGLVEGTPELARCVLSTQTGDAAKTVIVRPSTALPPVVTRISFFRMDRTVRREHEKLSCAQLGLDPINPEFNYCVVGLSEAFFDLDNPM